MASEFYVTRRVKCDECKGDGKVESEFQLYQFVGVQAKFTTVLIECKACKGEGYKREDVALDEALRELGEVVRWQ